jgi:hypothetical protein
LQVFSAFEEKVPFLYYEDEEQNNPTQKEKRYLVYYGRHERLI